MLVRAMWNLEFKMPESFSWRTTRAGAGMLHLRELQVLRRVCVVERQRGCGEIGSLLRPHFPPLDGTCPMRAR